MINPKISRATLGRAPAYLKFLRGIEDSTANISATTIAKELELGEVQVRKDLRALCGSGKPKTGYKVGELTASLASCLSERTAEQLLSVPGNSEEHCLTMPDLRITV